MPASEPQDERPREIGPDPWQPGSYPREALLSATIAGGMAGVVSHPIDNVVWKVERFCEGDTVSQFGMTGLTTFSPDEVLSMVGESASIRVERERVFGPVRVDPERVLAACEEAGERLALAAERREGVILATGHPQGLGMLYERIGRLLSSHGARLLAARDGFTWRDHGSRAIRYVGGVAVLTDGGAPIHTHDAGPMERMLEEADPDLVLGDHGFAGAAIERGIETISVADVNDPALIAARVLGRTRTVIVMDDNVRPEAYWPCFQAIAGRFPRPI